MRASPTLLLLLALAANSTIAAQSVKSPGIPASTGSISGLILEQGTRAPVRDAKVVALAPSGPQLVAISHEDGSYRIETVIPGKYLLRVEHQRYVATQPEGAWSAGLTIVEVVGGAHVRRIDFLLARAAVIRGRISDETGMPLARAIVVPEDADTRLLSPITTRTNDLGEYELRVPPGRFFIRAMEVFVFSAAQGASMANTEFLPTYYPGVSSREDGAALDVSAGDAVQEVNISLLRRVSHMIGGRVTSAGVLIEGARLSMVSSAGKLSRMRTRANGSFGFADLKPGRYILWARPAAEDSDEVAWQAVDLGESAVDVELTLRAGGRLRGRVVDELGQPMSDGARVVAALLDTSREIDPTSPDQVEIEADGAFELAGLFGTRALRVIGLPSGWSVKTILLNGRESPKEFTIIEGRTIDGISIVIAPR